MSPFPIDASVIGSADAGIKWNEMLAGDKAYRQSKLMVVMFNFELFRRLNELGKNISCYVIAQERVSTNIYNKASSVIGPVFRFFLPGPEKAARRIVALATGAPERHEAELVGTKMDKKTKAFAMSGVNQEKLWSVSEGIIERALNSCEKK